MAGSTKAGASSPAVVGPGLSPDALVSLTHRLRDLGVKRFEAHGVVVELSEAVVAVVTERELAKRARELVPVESGDAERKRKQDEDAAAEEAVRLELHSA